MNANKSNRREFIKTGITTSAVAASSFALNSNADEASKIHLDPEPLFDLSPYLYMQFMEPLGCTDGSVSAAWNYTKSDWRDDVIKTTSDLAPTMVRWGGCLSSYYRWREGVGPRNERIPMYNLLWGGIEPNQVGTSEFIDFCRRVGADPLMTINFESDGREFWMKDPDGNSRRGDAKEAADWVAYCNQPDHPLRQEHGSKEPYKIPYWQIGNETSYSSRGFDRDTAIRKTVEFAKAMKAADPSIKLIGWGDSGWSQAMIDGAGEHLEMIAFHHMFNPDQKPPVLAWNQFRNDIDATWDCLMNAYKPHENKIKQIYEETKNAGMLLAMTECHFTIPGRNRCDVLSWWAAGAAYARILNTHERYGERLKIATAADFCGTRWQNNALMISVPGGNSYLMPVARIMQLYRRHSGEQYINTINSPDGLDVTASRTGDRIFLHVVNTRRTQSLEASISIKGKQIASGRIFEISTDADTEVMQNDPGVITPKEHALDPSKPWRFPAASVSAVEIKLA